MALAAEQDKYKLDNYFSSESYAGGNEIFTNQNTIFHIVQKIDELSLTVIEIVLLLLFHTYLRLWCMRLVETLQGFYRLLEVMGSMDKLFPRNRLTDRLEVSNLLRLRLLSEWYSSHHIAAKLDPESL